MKLWIARITFIYLMVLGISTMALARDNHPGYIRPTARQVKLDLLASERGYFWVYHGKVLTQQDSIKIESHVPVQFIFTNKTNFDYQLDLRKNPFRVIDGYGTYSPKKTNTNLPAHEKTVIEFPPNNSVEWFFAAKNLYNVKIDKESYSDNTLIPRVPQDIHESSNPRINLSPEIDWFNEFGVYSNMIDINSVWASGKNSLELMYEHDWHDKYYSEVSFARSMNEQMSGYIGYEFERKDKEKRRGGTTDRGIVGVHYAFGYIDGDLRFDSDKRMLLRISTEIPLQDDFLLYADWDTDHDYRIKLGYKFTHNLALIADYHARYHGGAGIRYSF